MADEKTPLMDEDPSRRKTDKAPPVYVYLIAACATLNSVNLGFDVGVSSGVGLLVQEDMHLSDWELSLFRGAIQLMAAVGSMCSHWFCDHLGRCKTFTVSQAIFLTGMCLLVTSRGFTQLMISRLFTGFAIGVALAIDPLYISEVAPASHRGQLTTLSDIAISVGILLGFIANYAFADLPRGENWRMMPLCGAIGPTTLIILSLTVMPESPRWLAVQGRDDKAEEVLRNTHNAGEDVNILLTGIKSQAQEEVEYAKLGWQPLLRPDAQTRWMMIVGIGVAFAHQITGVESVVMYSPEIFKQAGVSRSDKELFFMTAMMGLTKTLCIIVSACYLDNFGRRPLLLWGMVGIAGSQLALSIGLAIDNSFLAVFGVFSFMCWFSVGIGPICWLLASEVFPTNIRAKAVSLATFTNRVTSGTVALTFLPLSDFLSLSGYFLLFAVISMFSGVAQFLLVPETKGKTLEKIKESFDVNFDPSRAILGK